MKKIFISLLTLFYVNAFAGEIGYVLLNDNINNIKSDKLLNIGETILINRDTHFYKNSNSLNIIYFNYINKNNLEKNILNKDFFYYNENIKTKILNYIKFNEIIFILVEINNTKSKLEKEIFEIKKEKNDYTLCTNSEEIIFSCKATNKKIISICSDKNKLTYRYGLKESNSELDYSSLPNKNINNFFNLAFHNYAKGYTEELSFTKNKYKYTFFSESHVYNESLSGIVVEKDNKKIAQINCDKNYIIDNLYKLKENFDFKENKIRYISGLGVN